jgi:methyl-accepting chemotaxis protein
VSFLRKFTIQQRLAMLVFIAVLGLSIQSVIGLVQEYNSLLTERHQTTKKLVENSFGIIEHFYALEQEGKLTQTQAQDQAKATIQTLRYDNNNYFWINDYTPTMIMHPLKPALNGKSLSGVKDPDGTALFNEMAQIVKSKGEGYVPYKWAKPGFDDPVDKISYVKGFQQWQWIIGSGSYLDDVESTFASKRNLIIIDALIIIAILVGFGYVIGNSILNPTRSATELMKDIAQGEGDLTQRLDDSGQDEISRLSRYFNEFNEKMQYSLQEVHSNSVKVLAHAESVASASESAQTFTELQNDNTTQVATAMEQMTSQIRDVSNNAEAAEQAANDSIKNTSEGKNIVSETISHIEELSANIDNVSNAISNLAIETESIGSVLDVIRGIADQTNLLALNAAIEAARAGEQGRGFAVVADEVRTLASRTGQSTDEIQAMIQKLQTGAKNAVDAVKISQEISTNTVAQASQADNSLSEIDRLMQIISDMNSQIARATEQQSQAADEVNLRINELSGMTDESVATTMQLTDASHQLKTSSHDMSDVVNRFKLN